MNDRKAPRGTHARPGGGSNPKTNIRRPAGAPDRPRDKRQAQGLPRAENAAQGQPARARTETGSAHGSPVRSPSPHVRSAPGTAPADRRPPKAPARTSTGAGERTDRPGPARRPLTPQQRRARAEAEKLLRIRRARARRRLAASIVLFLTLYLLLSALVFAAFYISYKLSPESDALYSVTIKISEKKSVSLPASEVNLDYGLYVPLSALENIHDYTVAGDADRLTVAVRETGDVLECANGSSNIVINGTPVSLSAPVVLSDGDCWLPAEAVTGFMSGYTCSFDDEKMVLTISLSGEQVGYTLKAQTPADPAEYPNAGAQSSPPEQ